MRIHALSCAVLVASAACGGEFVEDVETSGSYLKVERAIPGRYIVVLADRGEKLSVEEAGARGRAIAEEHGARIFHEYGHALQGFAAEMTKERAIALSRDPRVAFVEEDGEVQVIDTQNNPPWGLDRIDQRDLPLSATYTYNANGTGVTSYVIDTGIRITHTQFGGRASFGFTSINDGNGANDCHGHGTHVAGTIGGSTYGVAKNTNLVSVRVLSCSGSGSWAGVIAGVDWVTANRVLPAVANMSLGGGATASVDLAVQNSIAAGVTYSIAAGNSNADACNFSPARTPQAITVGATTITDARAGFSNYGTCLDIFAPGQDILSAWNNSDTASLTISGTSMAAPHVAGAAALYLQGNPSASPQAVRDTLVANATLNHVTNPGPGSPNALLYMGFIAPPLVQVTLNDQIGGDWFAYDAGQSFTPPRRLELEYVDICFYDFAQATSIQLKNGDGMNGSLIQAATSITNTGVGCGWGEGSYGQHWYRATFTTTTQLLSSQRYTITIHNPNVFGMAYHYTNPYAGGNLWNGWNNVADLTADNLMRLGYLDLGP